MSGTAPGCNTGTQPTENGTDSRTIGGGASLNCVKYNQLFNETLGNAFCSLRKIRVSQMGSLAHFPKVAEWLRDRGVAGVATGQVRESKIFTSILQTFLMGSDFGFQCLSHFLGRRLSWKSKFGVA